MTSTELIAKIKAEIERLQKYNHCMADNAINSNMRNFYDGEEDCCKQLLSFLSTLEPEKPMELDLEIEIEDYVEQRWQFAEDLNAAVPIYLYDMTLNELKDCARHFAEWGAERQKDKDTRDMYMSDNRHFEKVYQLGKKDMKEQMMKEARNHFVLRVLSDNATKKMIELYNDEVDCKFGDVVRIIVVKEEENGQSD